VAHADLNGFHVMPAFFEKKYQSIKNHYYAIGYLVNSWVVNDNGEDCKDVSREVHKLLLRIKDIILDGPTQDQLRAVDNWLEAQEKTASEHLKSINVICEGYRMISVSAPFSLSTAYNIKKISGQIILQYNEQSKSITLSCIDEPTAKKFFGKNGVVTPLQKFFGKKAGGKIAIGGSPRDQDLQPELLTAFQEFLQREYFNVPTIINLD
jgi:hypothetical protein